MCGGNNIDVINGYGIYAWNTFLKEWLHKCVQMLYALKEYLSCEENVWGTSVAMVTCNLLSEGCGG